MPPKAISTIVTTLGSVSDTSIADIDLQVVIINQLQIIVNQFTSNGQVLKNKIDEIDITKVKMPLVKKFSGKKAKLKGLLT